MNQGTIALLFNGGLVQKNDTGEIMEKAALQLADIHELVAVAAELDLPLDVVSEEIVLCFADFSNESVDLWFAESIAGLPPVCDRSSG